MLLQHVLFFIFGLCVGSFINALVYRLREGITLGGRSFCPQCKKKILWFDNIPILSFLILRGHCRHCREKIPYRYPVVELLTGLVFGVIGYFFFDVGESASWLETGYLLLLSLLLIALAVYDFFYMEIPLSLVLVSGMLSLFYLGFTSLAVTPWWTSPLALGLAGGLTLFLFFFLLVFFSQETWMGWGDVWIGFLGGLVVGLSSTLFLLTVSSMLGALVGIAGILLGKKKMKSAVPFAPFLMAGIILTLVIKETSLRFSPFFFL